MGLDFFAGFALRQAADFERDANLAFAGAGRAGADDKSAKARTVVVVAGSEYSGAPLTSCSNAGKTLLLSDSTDADSLPGSSQYAYAVSNWGPEQPSLTRHNGWANCLFVDQHAEAHAIVPDMQQPAYYDMY